VPGRAMSCVPPTPPMPTRGAGHRGSAVSPSQVPPILAVSVDGLTTQQRGRVCRGSPGPEPV
jgi:hypothetical protein